MDSEMTKRKVVRDRDGAVINIGPWDYCYDNTADGIAVNPLPEGAYEDEANIIEGWDGGLYEANDPRAKETAE